MGPWNLAGCLGNMIGQTRLFAFDVMERLQGG